MAADELSRQMRAVTDLVSILPVAAFMQQSNYACITVIDTMVREVVLGGALTDGADDDSSNAGAGTPSEQLQEGGGGGDPDLFSDISLFSSFGEDTSCDDAARAAW